MTTINLGEKPESNSSDAAAVPVDPKTYYPTIYLRGGEELKGLPDSGEFVIKGKVVSRGENERDGKYSCNAEIEVQSISFDGKKAPKSPEKSASDSFDEAMGEVEKKTPPKKKKAAVVVEEEEAYEEED